MGVYASKFMAVWAWKKDQTLLDFKRGHYMKDSSCSYVHGTWVIDSVIAAFVDSGTTIADK